MSANEGHYLDRLAFIMEKYSMMPEYRKLVVAVSEFVEGNYKPSFVDSLVYDFSVLVIFNLKEMKISDDEWQDIAWGLDYDALREHGLLHYRKA